jgi:4-alpha-glucanotransferase
MNTIVERAVRCGIETEFQVAFGRQHIVSLDVLGRLLETFKESADGATRLLPRAIVLRDRDSRRLRMSVTEGRSVRWTISDDEKIVSGTGTTPSFQLPDTLQHGIHRLRVGVRLDESETTEDVLLIVCSDRAYQGGATTPERMWALAVQLYAVRSERNWGHGDFTDLANLVDLAAEVGASGIGLNPVHALFDDRAEDASPYSPNSRLFLNPLYIDVDAIPEFPGMDAAGLRGDIARLRKRELVDYGGVADVKLRALKLAYGVFRGGATGGRARFDRFRAERDPSLNHFACFEFLRRKFAKPWWQWPAEWRGPSDAALDDLREREGTELGFYAWLQWIAHEQLDLCRTRARDRGLPIGLYIDVAVGVRNDGFDAWSQQDAILSGVSVGAPPDLLNTAGQNWGLTSFNPIGLQNHHFAPYRATLDASMQYAGAIRLDHVLGLKRLYLIPNGAAATEGAYVRFPFEELLAVTALASAAHKCIVIGEDLGTVPADFRQTLADWGLWSYQLMIFERLPDGGFAAPASYRKDALVAFATHDLPTFAAWKSAKDLDLKNALGMDPGETREERDRALRALARALGKRGVRSLDLLSIVGHLASAPSRLAIVAMEDVLGSEFQVNLPATVDEYPNWRHRLPIDLERLADHRTLNSISTIMQSCGRGLQGGTPPSSV